MSQIEKRASDLDKARRPGVKEIESFVDHPILACPIELRGVAPLLFIEWRPIIKDEAAFYLRLRRYHRAHGITPEDLEEVFDRLSLPGRSVNMRYVSDFFAEFAGEVGSIVQRRRAREETEARRREATEGEKAASDSRPFVETLTVGMFKPDKT